MNDKPDRKAMDLALRFSKSFRKIGGGTLDDNEIDALARNLSKLGGRLQIYSDLETEPTAKAVKDCSEMLARQADRVRKAIRDEPMVVDRLVRIVNSLEPEDYKELVAKAESAFHENRSYPFDLEDWLRDSAVAVALLEAVSKMQIFELQPKRALGAENPAVTEMLGNWLPTLYFETFGLSNFGRKDTPGPGILFVIEAAGGLGLGQFAVATVKRALDKAKPPKLKRNRPSGPPV